MCAESPASGARFVGRMDGKPDYVSWFGLPFVITFFSLVIMVPYVLLAATQTGNS